MGENEQIDPSGSKPAVSRDTPDRSRAVVRQVDSERSTRTTEAGDDVPTTRDGTSTLANTRPSNSMRRRQHRSSPTSTTISRCQSVLHDPPHGIIGRWDRRPASPGSGERRARRDSREKTPLNRLRRIATLRRRARRRASRLRIEVPNATKGRPPISECARTPARPTRSPSPTRPSPLRDRRHLLLPVRRPDRRGLDGRPSSRRVCGLSPAACDSRRRSSERPRRCDAVAEDLDHEMSAIDDLVTFGPRRRRSPRRV